MFDYNIHKEASNKEFKSACVKIEKAFENAKKDNMLVDVDGSLVQSYWVDGKEIRILNDYEVDAVYAKSEIELDNILN